MGAHQGQGCNIYYCKLPCIQKEQGVEIRGQYHQIQHQAGLYLLKYGLKEQFGLAENEYEIIRIKNEKPHLLNHPNIHFNISHCDGLAVCAIATYPVGIDAESSSRTVSASVYTRALHPTERLRQSYAADSDAFFLRYWTLKESYLKLIGMGISCDLTRLLFHPYQTTSAGDPCSHYRLDGEDAYFMQWKLEEHFISFASHCSAVPDFIETPLSCFPKGSCTGRNREM